MPRGAAGAAGRFGRRPYFPQADWLWNRIPSLPVLDTNSAAMVTGLSAAGTKHMCNVIEFGVALRGPDGITAATPRYDVVFRQAVNGGGDNWGPDPFSVTMPIPDDVIVPGIALPETTYDGHVSVADRRTGQVWSLWRGRDNVTSWSAWWGAQVSLWGDGRESPIPQNGSSTASRLSRFGGVIRASEITAAHAANSGLDHALFFATSMVAPTVFRYPAANTDGANGAGVGTPIPEGARVQLDPSINVDGLSGITPIEKIVAKTLQTHGAYVGDQTSDTTVRAAFLFEYLGEASTVPQPNQPYLDVDPGFYDYYDMTHIPWSSLRVLRQWDGL